MTSRVGHPSPRRTALGLTLIALAALCLASCSSSALYDISNPQLATYYEQELRWAPCESRQRALCASVSVPIDYTNLELGDLSLALIMAPARSSPTDSETADQSGADEGETGTLVVNVGAPGHVVVGSTGAMGNDLADVAFPYTTGRIRAHYDVVSWDLRGTGSSGGFDCLDEDAELKARTLDRTPDDDAELQALRQAAADYLQGCRRAAGSLLTHLGMAEQVQDLDVIRAVLGAERLDYLGISVGALLGARYAERYPDRTGRITLDSLGMAIDDSPSDWLPEHAVALEDSLERALFHCMSRPSCPLGDTPAAARDRLQKYLTKLDAQPTPLGGQKRLTREQVVWALEGALRDAEDGYSELIRVLEQAYAGVPLFLAALAEQHDPAAGEGGKRAMLCSAGLGGPPEHGVENHDRAALTERAPVFGETLGWADEALCAGWPAADSAAVLEPDPEGATIEALLVTTPSDPWTLATLATAVNGLVPEPLRLTYQGAEHAPYLVSACVRSAVDNYLLTGQAPRTAQCPDRYWGSEEGLVVDVD